MDDTDNETSMNDELSEFGTALVRVATVPDEKFRQVAELVDGKVGRERSLSTLFPDDTDTCIDHRRTSGMEHEGREDT